MARVPITEAILDTHGEALSNIEVYVYDAGTTDDVTVYQAETGPAAYAFPLLTDDGMIPGWVEGGSYDLVYEVNNVEYTRRYNEHDASEAIIPDGSITEPKIATNAVTSDKIAAGAVGASEIGTGEVGASEIATGAVGEPELADGGVTNDKIADDAVDTAQIADDAVENAQVADNAIAQANMQDDSVGAAELIDGSVGAAAQDTIPMVRAAVTEHVPTSGFAPVGFGAFTESYDTANMHDPSVNNTHFTAPIDGYYHLDITNWADNQFLAGETLGMRVEVTGATIHYVEFLTEGIHAWLPLSDTIELSAGDYVEVTLFHDHATPVFVDVTVALYWVGPT